MQSVSKVRLRNVDGLQHCLVSGLLDRYWISENFIGESMITIGGINFIHNWSVFRQSRQYFEIVLFSVEWKWLRIFYNHTRTVLGLRIIGFWSDFGRGMVLPFVFQEVLTWTANWDQSPHIAKFQTLYSLPVCIYIYEK